MSKIFVRIIISDQDHSSTISSRNLTAADSCNFIKGTGN